MKYLFDADLFVFRASASCEHKITAKEAEFDGTVAGDVVMLPIETAYQRLENLLQVTYNTLGIKDNSNVSMFLAGETNYRKRINPEYKANRPPKPVYLPALRDYVIQNCGAVCAEDQEADDCLGIAQTKCWDAGEQSCIVSVDKDLYQIPGTHFRFLKWTGSEAFPATFEEGIIEIDEDEALYNFYVQLLMGDNTDNVKGCPKIGPVKAEKALRPFYGDEIGLCHAVYEKYAEAYPDMCIDELDDLITMVGQMVWIRRQPDQLWVSPLTKGVI